MTEPLPTPDLAELADPDMAQYFLTNPAKIEALLDAAGILPTDDVVEVGAGAGTVARHVPARRSLILVELDARMAPILAAAVPAATVLVEDAVTVLPRLHFDVLLANLPTRITENLLQELAGLDFRTAVLAVDEHADVRGLEGLDVAEVTTITGQDFTPPQPSISRLVKVTRRPPRSPNVSM